MKLNKAGEAALRFEVVPSVAASPWSLRCKVRRGSLLDLSFSPSLWLSTSLCPLLFPYHVSCSSQRGHATPRSGWEVIMRFHRAHFVYLYTLGAIYYYYSLLLSSFLFQLCSFVYKKTAKSSCGEVPHVTRGKQATNSNSNKFQPPTNFHSSLLPI